MGDRQAGFVQAEAVLLHRLGYAHQELRQFQQAVPYYQQALILHRENKNREAEADVLHGLGYAHKELRQFQQAISHYQQALTIYREDKNRAKEAEILAQLGLSFFGSNQYQQAIEVFQQQLAIPEVAENRESKPLVLAMLSFSQATLSQYQPAYDNAQQALQLSQETNNREVKAFALASLGIIHGSLGEYQQAADLAQQALIFARELQNQQLEQLSLMTLGGVHTNLQEYQLGIDYLQQALEIARKENGLNEANILAIISYAYSESGQPHLALSSAQQALEISRANNDRSIEASALLFTGRAQNELGQTSEAIENSQQALRFMRAVGMRESEGYALSTIGEALAKQGQTELAILFFKESVRLVEAIRGELRQLPQETQLAFIAAKQRSNIYRQLADLLLQQDRVLEAQRVLDLLKVQELDDYLRDVRGNSETRSGVEFLRQEQIILERYNAQQQNAIELGQELAQLQAKKSSGQLTPAEEQRRSQLDQLQRELNQGFNEFARSPEVQELLKQLSFEARDQTISLGALDSLRNNLTALDAVLLYPLILDDRIELIITTPNSPPLRRTVQGVGRAELNQAIVAFRDALDNPDSDAVTPARQLYRWLIEPIEADLARANVKTIIYAPDGQLRYVPLAALHDGTGWLIQRYRVNNITAASLQEFNAQPPIRPRILAGAFADQRIVYPVRLGERTVNFAGLPFAGKEVSQLAETLPNISTLIDSNFSLDTVEPELNQFNILHFATHAAVVPGDVSQSFILFGNGDRPTLRDIETWTLNNVELVVLSACETGLGGFDNNGEQIGVAE